MTNNMFFIANWKMFGDFKSVNSVKKVIKLSKIRKYKKAQIIYCPPFTLIDRFLNFLFFENLMTFLVEFIALKSPNIFQFAIKNILFVIN